MPGDCSPSRRVVSKMITCCGSDIGVPFGGSRWKNKKPPGPEAQEAVGEHRDGARLR
jgi:hypothetical protein